MTGANSFFLTPARETVTPPLVNDRVDPLTRGFDTVMETQGKSSIEAND